MPSIHVPLTLQVLIEVFGNTGLGETVELRLSSSFLYLSVLHISPHKLPFCFFVKLFHSMVRSVTLPICVSVSLRLSRSASLSLSSVF